MGLPSASARAWILVLSPPRERPIAWSSPSFFWRRRCADALARWCCRSSRIRCRRRRRDAGTSVPRRRTWPNGKTACVNLDRIAKPLRQVAPGDPSAIAVEHCLDEQTVVSCRHPDVAFTAGQQVLDTIPLVVTKGVAAHRSASQADRLGIEETAVPESPVRPCRADLLCTVAFWTQWRGNKLRTRPNRRGGRITVSSHRRHRLIGGSLWRR